MLDHYLELDNFIFLKYNIISIITVWRLRYKGVYMDIEIRKDIFISYKNDGIGNNFATRLVEDLRDNGYSVYFNPDEVKSGNFPERLRKAIEGCKDFVCIVTAEYIEKLLSDDEICWVRDELICAKENKKPIIPILVNGVEMPAANSIKRKDIAFFANIDAYIFPEQYLTSPFSVFCKTLKSKI